MLNLTVSQTQRRNNLKTGYQARGNSRITKYQGETKSKCCTQSHNSKTRETEIERRECFQAAIKGGSIIVKGTTNKTDS